MEQCSPRGSSGSFAELMRRNGVFAELRDREESRLSAL
jgi:hypothetical protein